MSIHGLWAWQEKGIEEAAAGIGQYGGFGLWWGVRTGKTPTALGVADRLGARRTLVVAPRAVVEDERTWELAAERHLDAADTLGLTQATTAKKAEALGRFGDGIVTVTWDNVWREPLAAAVRAWKPDLLVADEIHMMSSPSSRRAKFMLPFAKTVEARLGLSGTPMGQTPMGVWAPYQVLVPGPTLFPATFTQFRGRYTRLISPREYFAGRKGRDVIITAGRGGALSYWKMHDLEDMSERMYRCASRVLLDEVIDQTPQTSETLHVRLEPEAQRIYGELDRDFISSLGDGAVATVANAMTKTLRLQQCTGGAVVDEMGVTREVSQAKRRRLAEWLETVGDEPVVVFARFHHDLDAIHGAAADAGLTSGELSGRVRQLSEWKAGETQVLAVQEQVGGAGIDLTRAHLCVYYSLSYSLLDFDQSMGRVRGPMQKHAVAVYFLTVAGSVDEDILDALEARAEISDFVVERGLQRRARLSR